MKLAQVTLAVPDDLYAGIVNGYLELAGLVKDRNHVIRKHLPRVADIVPKKNAAKKMKSSSAIQVLKNNKGIAIGVGIVVAVGTGVAYAVHSIKEKKAEKVEECVENFQKALKTYLKATKSGKLNGKVVDSLLDALAEVEKSKAGNSVMLSIPSSQLNELINSIFDYTKRLADANELNMQIRDPKKGNKNSISNLQSYLEIQKQIIEKVA